MNRLKRQSVTKMLSMAGILAASFMPHNPFAWGIFALTMGLMLTTVTNSD